MAVPNRRFGCFHDRNVVLVHRSAAALYQVGGRVLQSAACPPPQSASVISFFNASACVPNTACTLLPTSMTPAAPSAFNRS